MSSVGAGELRAPPRFLDLILTLKHQLDVKGRNTHLGGAARWAEVAWGSPAGGSLIRLALEFERGSQTDTMRPQSKAQNENRDLIRWSHNLLLTVFPDSPSRF